MKTIKRSFSIFAALIVTLTAILSCSFNVQAFDIAPGIMFNQYFRLRHAGTGYYLTMNSSSDSVSVICSLQARSEGNSRQIFYLSIDYNANTYYFSPNTSSTGKVLSLQNNSDITNNTIILNTNVSYDRQKWKISRTAYGYKITSNLGTKVLAPKSLGTTVGTTIATATYSSSAMCNWILEPAYSGTATYCVTTNDLTSTNSSYVDTIVTRLGAMGYNSYRTNLPSYGEVRERFASSRFNVLHGHGGPGYIFLKQADGSSICMCSENAGASDIVLDVGAYRSSYVMVISCYSATDSSLRQSLVDKIYSSGAMCVTGFKNSVTDGEKYLYYMSYNLKFGGTINEAFEYADSFFVDIKDNADCPANPDNRVTLGFTDFCPYML